MRYLAAEAGDCSAGGTEPAAVSGSTWYAHYAGTIAVGLNFSGEILQRSGLLFLSVLHVEDLHSKTSTLNYSDFTCQSAVTWNKNLTLFIMTNWLDLLLIILTQLQFIKTNQKKRRSEIRFFTLTCNTSVCPLYFIWIWKVMYSFWHSTGILFG